jgi:hypothetical protein
MEFVEDDELRGVVLAEPVTGVRIGLRDRAFPAASRSSTGSTSSPSR